VTLSTVYSIVDGLFCGGGEGERRVVGLCCCLGGSVLETTKNIDLDLLLVNKRRVKMLRKVVFIFTFMIYLHCFNASKLNVPKLLLPYYSQAPTNFTLEASEGCFTWYDLNPCNIAQTRYRKR